MRITSLLSVLLTVCVVTASPAVSAKKAEDSAQGAFGGGQNHERSVEERSQHQYENTVRHRTYSDDERYRIRNFYQQREQNEPGDKGKDHPKNAQKDKQKSIPQGLEKKLQRGGDLPPGWEKKIIPGDRLDRDLYRQSERLPDELDRAIGRVAGEENRRIGNKIIRVLEGDATVIDVIDILDASGVME
ncbi:hypothetical protein [uncultured Amphritea sp.]|uniref:hypothetical protein n=1 Tax=uncultured Amphritea sp. TaxID=981605 RepID=UPI00260DC13F|nr:hypothetical protein [uncultured Amphritea sp.]